jgi:hypothetical protein
VNGRRTPAVGGTRDLPPPDAVARDYLLLALRLDQHLPGTVDGYYGPADLKARVDTEQLRSPARLAGDAAALRDALGTDVHEPDRRHWLNLQLRALETLARVRAGEELPYLEEVERCFAIVPEARPDERFEGAAHELDDLLAGSDDLASRLAAEDDAWTVPPEHVGAVVDVLVRRFRERAQRQFGLPPGEDLRVSLVRGQPWSGYNWYDGGYRSRVDVNLDLPIRLPALVDTMAHETYPGHHLEHALKEQVLVEGLGRLEASVLLINTPECLISEGLASLGLGIALQPDELVELLVEIAPSAGLGMAADPRSLGASAARQPAIAACRDVLGEARVNAALMRHVDGATSAQVVDYLVSVGRYQPDRAAKTLEFIQHPLWRLYVHVYPEGAALLRRWVDAAPGPGRQHRFGRLLREPLTPVAIRADLDAAADVSPGP